MCGDASELRCSHFISTEEPLAEAVRKNNKISKTIKDGQISLKKLVERLHKGVALSD